MTSRIEMAHPATRGMAGMRRFKAIAKPITYSHLSVPVFTQPRRQYSGARIVLIDRETYLGDIGSDNGNLGEEVEAEVGPSWKESSTSLGEIEPRNCA